MSDHPLTESEKQASFLSSFAEGNFEPSKYARAPVAQPSFIRMIVIDVISDPNSDLIDEVKKQNWHEIKVTNMNLVDVLPRNTIVAKRVGEEGDPMFVFPFFPSHLAMPCKPGEAVWVMRENPEAQNFDIAYWFCRIVEPHTSDDVNHAHPGRAIDPSFSPGSKERLENEKQGTAESGENVWNELRNSPVIKIGDRRESQSENLILRGEAEDVFEKLVTATNASKLTTYEAVPRFRKRPGDVVLEGSNNALIVLGTDRPGPIEIEDKKKSVESGTIDIVAGRGQTEETLGKVSSTTSIKDSKGKKKGKEIKKELNKSIEVLKKTEGDPDLKNDRSRIYVTQKSNVDKNFGLEEYNSSSDLKFEIDTAEIGDSGVVIKSDKIRVIGRKDLQITVLGFEDNDGKIVDADSDDNRCTITINGKTGKIFIDAKQSISVRSEKGDIEVVAKDGKQSLQAKKDFDVKTESKMNFTANNDINVKSDSLINLGNSPLEWAPKFESFLKDLTAALRQIHIGLLAGTQGSPVAQSLVTYVGNSSSVIELIAKMPAGFYYSQKVKNE